MPSLEALREGRFLRPFPSPTPVTSFRSLIPSPRAPGGWKTEVFEDRSLIAIEGEPRSSVTYQPSEATDHFNLTIGMGLPNDEPIVVGKYYENDFGKFVVWEAGRAPDNTTPEAAPIVRLAVDDNLGTHGRSGMVRVNSSFKGTDGSSPSSSRPGVGLLCSGPFDGSRLRESEVTGWR